MDYKIGSIVVCLADEESSEGEQGVTERRYVYLNLKHRGKPYYLTKTQNRIFVLDTERIELFPEPNAVPEYLLGRIRDYTFTPPEKNPKPTGTISVQIPTKKEGKLVFLREARDVFCDDSDEGEPTFYSLCGPRRQKVEKNRIRFF